MKIEVTRPGRDEIARLGVMSWPVWESPVAEFDWSYDRSETCLFLEGEAEVSAGGSAVRISAGEMAVFPAGLSCRWRVTKPVKKHYSFGKKAGL